MLGMRLSADAHAIKIASPLHKYLVAPIIIPKNVTEIRGSFKDCTGLKNVVISDGVTVIGRDAFEDCSSLTNVVIPKSVSKIGRRAFAGCVNLVNIKIPDSVDSIGEMAFARCIKLVGVVIPKNVKRICSGAFLKCSSLEHVNILEGVSEICNAAFAKCIGLASIRIPTSVKRIGSGSCKKVPCTIYGHPCEFDEGEFDEGEFDEGEFDEGEFDEDVVGAFEGCVGLVKVEISEGFKEILQRSFAGCVNLRNVITPNTRSGVKIGYAAFEKCTSLETIIIRASSIDEYAFKDCIGLLEVQIKSSSLEILESDVFKGCTKLAKIMIPDSVTMISDSAFNGCINLNLNQIPRLEERIENYHDWEAQQEEARYEAEARFYDDYDRYDDYYDGVYYADPEDAYEVFGSKLWDA